LLSAQIDDKFISLDNDSNYSFNSSFNQKYQLFPQIFDIYQGFIVKPFERQGCYTWLQIKQYGSLRDTIVWLDDADCQSLLKKLPLTSKNSELVLHYNDLINRAKYLSVEGARSKRLLTKEYGETINGSLVRDTTLRYDPYYDTEKELRQRNLTDTRWTITTTNLKPEKFSIIGKSGHELIVQKNDDFRTIRINEIEKIKFRPPNKTGIGVVLGVAIGEVVGYWIGNSLFKPPPPDAAVEFINIGQVFTGIVGAAILGLGGGIVMYQHSKGQELVIEGETEYDRYFDFDRKTYFSIPEIKLDSATKVKRGNDTNILIANINQIILTNDSVIATLKPVDMKSFSLGFGLSDPLFFNVHFQYYINVNLGVLYTGFPVAVSLHRNEVASRFGCFLRVSHTNSTRHNIGISLGFGKKSGTYYSETSERVGFNNYYEIGAFYEFSYFGIFTMCGIYFPSYNFYNGFSANETFGGSAFSIQIGYRFTI
jgi:hypothetical protein